MATDVIYKEDERLPNGSIICWSRRTGEKVPVRCGNCGAERLLWLQNTASPVFTGLCRKCAYTLLRKHTATETLSSGSVVYWNERQGLGRDQGIPVQCGICGRVRPVTASKIPNRNFTGYCSDCARTGDRSHFWKSGRFKHPNGYILVRLTPDHPFYCMADSHHLVPEHRLRMAEHLGRFLREDEIVHHKNGVKDDNRLENLDLLARHLHHFGFEPSDDETEVMEESLWVEIVKLIDIILRRR